MRSSRDARKASDASRAAQTRDGTWLKSTKMESRRCVRQSHDANEAMLSRPGVLDILARADNLTRIYRRSEDGEQGQEHKEDHGKEAGSKDAEGEAAGQEGEEVAALCEAARSA